MKKYKIIYLNFKSTLIKSHLKGFLGRKAALKLREERCKIIKIQRCFRKRFKLRESKCRLIQRHFREHLSLKRHKKLQRLHSGFLHLYSVYRVKHMKTAMRKLVVNTMAIRIQSRIRACLAIRIESSLRKERLRSRMESLFKRHLFSQLQISLRDAYRKRELSAALVQRQMRRYLWVSKVALAVKKGREYKGALLL